MKISNHNDKNNAALFKEMQSLVHWQVTDGYIITYNTITSRKSTTSSLCIRRRDGQSQTVRPKCIILHLLPTGAQALLIQNTSVYFIWSNSDHFLDI